MPHTNALATAAITGALIGAVGGALSLIVGLCVRKPRKALVGLAACVLAGAIAGTSAVIPVAVISLFTVIRPEKKLATGEVGRDLVFKYKSPFVWLAFIGLPIVSILPIILCGAAFFLFLSSGSIAVKMQAVLIGLLGVAFGWLAVVSARNWYALLSEVTLSGEGVSVKYRASLQFVPWGSLVRARYRKALGQLDLEFKGQARRVILGNVDLDPQREKVLKALAFVESVTGRSVAISIF